MIQSLYDFYQHQPSQISKINQLKDWFYKIEHESPTRFDKRSKQQIKSNHVLLVIGDTGIGKTKIIQDFLSLCKYNVIHIGKLFDIYDHTNTYSIKDFIPKLLKQKNVSDVSTKKLLLIDSLEEFMVIQKTILRDIIESIDTLGMPVVLVSERISFDALEKKVIVKLRKEATIVELDPPNLDTIRNYLKNNNSYLISNPKIEQMMNECNGDLRTLQHLMQFYKIPITFSTDETIDQRKDNALETEKAIMDISGGTLTDSFYRCESDPFIYGMLTYENYIHSRIKTETHKKNIIDMICFSDFLEKKLFKNQQWELLEIYSFFSTIYPWKQLEPPNTILSSSTLQKYMNTKKRNRKATLDF